MVALQICKELIDAICYKLRMFGVELDGLANVFCDDCGVVKNGCKYTRVDVDEEAQCN
jgi:hypothetical protein